jgi:hypothetical protein
MDGGKLIATTKEAEKPSMYRISWIKVMSPTPDVAQIIAICRA